MKKQKTKMNKQKMTLIDLKQKELGQRKSKQGFWKNFQLQITEIQQIKKQKMHLNKKLMLGKMIWQMLKSLESKNKNSLNFINANPFTRLLSFESFCKEISLKY